MKKKVLALALSATMGIGAVMAGFSATAMPAFAANDTTTQQALTTEQATKVQHQYKAYEILTGTKKTITKDDGSTETVLVDYKLGKSLDSSTEPLGLWNKIHADGFKVLDDRNQEITEFAKADLDDIARSIHENYPISTTIGTGAEILAAYFAGSNLSNEMAVNKDTLEIDGGTSGWYLLVDITPELDNDDLRMYMDRPQLQFTFDGTVSVNKKRSTIWIDKEVEDKNDSLPSVTVYNAKGGTADYDIGDEVPFQITSAAPENLSAYSKYTYSINDKQQDGLDFPQNLTVKVVESTGETVLTAGTDYTVEQVNLDNGKKANDFNINFTDLVALGIEDGAKFVVNYTSVLNEDAVAGAKGNKNEARVTFFPGDEGEGNTPWDIVIVFTYKPEVNKFDQSGASLDGAEFSLQKLEATYDDVNKKYNITKDADGNDTVIDTKAFVTPHDKDENNADDHTFSINGIDDGVYKIVEDNAPAGYNKIDPIYFVVVATHDNGKLTALDIYDLNGKPMSVGDTITGAIKSSVDGKNAEDNANIWTDIINQKGVVLPSTGGIGTTIFYIVGGVLVVGAVVLLIVRRKMRTEEE